MSLSDNHSRKKPRDSRLGKRIILLLVMISGTITLMTTLTQLYFSHQKQFSDVEKRQHEIETIQLNLIGSALWNFDIAHLQQRLDALVNIPHIDYLMIKSDNFQLAAGKKVQESGSISTRNFDIVHYDTFNDRFEKIGELHLESDTSPIYASLINQFFTTFFLNLIKTVIVCYLILMIFHYSINERLFTITQYLRSYNPRHPGPPLKITSRKVITSEHDEVAMLAYDVNKLTDNLSTLYTTLKDEKQRVQDFADVASDWLWEIDGEFRLTYCSEEMRLALNIDDEVSLSIQKIERLKNNDTLFSAIKRKQPFEQLDVEMDLPHGKQYLLFNGKTIWSKQEMFLGYRGTAINITELKEAQLHLELLNESLEMKVTKRTEELEKSLYQLEQAQDQLIESEKLAALGGLVAGVAHEVNTPLGISVTATSVIIEATQTLADAFVAETLTTEQFQEQIEKLKSGSDLIDQNLNRAAKLVRNFKQTAVDQISESRDQFNVHQVLSSLITSLHPETRKIPVTPQLEGNRSIIMNSLPGVLTQIISNLIINSVRHGFTRDSQNPCIRVRFMEDGTHIIFEYTDNGVGIPAHLHKKIFEPFFTTKRNQGGSGLGLNLVYNLIYHKLNGTLSFHSEEGHGVRYTMTLPKEVINKVSKNTTDPDGLDESQ